MPVFAVLIWAFTLLLVGQLFTFISTSHNIAIVGVCFIVLCILSLRSLILFILPFLTHLETNKKEGKRIMWEIIIPAFALLLGIFSLVSIESLKSLGIGFLGSPTFLACSMATLFVIQAISVFIVQNSIFSSILKASNNSKEKKEIHNLIFPEILFFLLSFPIMLISIVITSTLTIFDLPSLLIDTSIKFILFISFYIPLATIFLIITDESILGEYSV